MLALRGYDTYGLDVSEKAVETAREYAANELRDPSAYNFKDASTLTCSPERATCGTANFLVGNFFEREWESLLATKDGHKFDLIYDYTVCCGSSSSALVSRKLFCSVALNRADDTLVLVCSLVGYAPRLGSSHE